MTIIDMPQNATHCDFLVENLLVPTYEFPLFDLIYQIVGLDSPWNDEIYNYLCNNILPPKISNNEHRTFIFQNL